MGSPTWDWRRNMCPKEKVAFRSWEDARRAAGRATWKNKQAGRNEKADAYLCEHCGYWHVGRGPRGGEREGTKR